MNQQAENVDRHSVEALNQILGRPFHVLDNGFVRVVDYMGSDAAIVQAARVSYGKGTKKVREDRELIRYLLRHSHSSPFEMCDIKLHIRVPMDCWRQWIRHRTASVNEYSTRYSIAIAEAQTTRFDAWRLQSQDNRQGSEDFLDAETGQTFTQQEADLQNLARSVYNQRIETGIAREQARKDLPLSTYTEAYWKINLRNLLHFLELRMDAHAQIEIRSYAEIIGRDIVARWCPLTWEAFQDYQMGSLTFSRTEQEILKALCQNDQSGAVKAADDAGWLKQKDGALRFHLERSEFEAKLKKMDLPVPWTDSK